MKRRALLIKHDVASYSLAELYVILSVHDPPGKPCIIWFGIENRTNVGKHYYACSLRQANCVKCSGHSSWTSRL